MAAISDPIAPIATAGSTLSYDHANEWLRFLDKPQISPTSKEISITPPSLEGELSSREDHLEQAEFRRTEAYPIEELRGALPEAAVPADIDHAAIISTCIRQLAQLSVASFTEGAIWRDVYALTGITRTFNGPKSIQAAWDDLKDLHRPSDFALIPGTSKIVRMGPDTSWIQARYSFRTSGQPHTLCSGQIGVVPDSKSSWKIWLLTTILEEIQGFPNPDYLGPQSQGAILTDPHDRSAYECVVVGAGYAGLNLSGRFKAMNVKYLTLEKHPRVGDNWRTRYETARFHTSRDYSEMPLERAFRPEDDYFLVGSDLARGYEDWCKKLELNVWTSSALKSATYDQETKTWTLTVDRSGETITIKSNHIVLAIGGGGTIPVMPQLADREQFQGTLMHSVDYRHSRDWKGLKGVVIGSANTAHDVAEDMVAAGMSSVTMVQRGRTAVFPIEYYKAWSDPIYNDVVPIEEADRQIMATPLAITRQASILGHNHLASQDQERFDSLERAGFRCERYGDLWKLLSQRLGGHYMDVGASAKISAGLIKIKGTAKPTGLTARGLKFHDGSEVEADVIVFCTGFEHDVRKEATKIVGSEVGKKLEDYWDIDREGELRGVYKPHGHPGIWYTGGGVTYARFYSRFIALQIKADVSGVPLRTYRKQALEG